MFQNDGETQLFESQARLLFLCPESITFELILYSTTTMQYCNVSAEALQAHSHCFFGDQRSTAI